MFWTGETLFRVLMCGRATSVGVEQRDAVVHTEALEMGSLPSRLSTSTHRRHPQISYQLLVKIGA